MVDVGGLEFYQNDLERAGDPQIVLLERKISAARKLGKTERVKTLELQLRRLTSTPKKNKK